MRRVVLIARPVKDPRVSDFRVEEFSLPSLAEGQLQVRFKFLSLDPYVRLSMDEKPIGGIPSLPLGAPPIGRAVAEILESRHPDFAVGELIEGRMPWAEQAVIDGTPGLRRLRFGNIPMSYAVGALGMPGQTAYAGIVNVGRLAAGQTVVISAAAGGVGLLAGNIAKILGARAIGIAGGPEKCAAVEAAGFDRCLDYKAPDFTAQLAGTLAGGFDVYFENVGGDLTLQVMPYAKLGARVALCGLLAVYGTRHEAGPDHLPEFMRFLFQKMAEVKAFHGESLGGAAALDQLRSWIESEQLHPRETILDGIDAVPEGFGGIFWGNRTIGKVVVRMA